MSKQFDELSNFILNEMRMSHIYQPVMLIELLGRQGSASTTEIAKALLGYDVSQVEYYEHITKNMVGKVLTQSRGITSKDKNQYGNYMLTALTIFIELLECMYLQLNVNS